MKEPVFITLGFRNDGIANPIPITVTQFPKRKDRAASCQFAYEDVLTIIGENMTAIWWAEWNGDEYDLIEPMTELEVARAKREAMERA